MLIESLGMIKSVDNDDRVVEKLTDARLVLSSPSAVRLTKP